MGLLGREVPFFQDFVTPLRVFRNKVAQILREKYGIDSRIAYPKPIYDQPLYKKKIVSSKKMDCPVAEMISKKILNLPIFPQMKDEQIDYVAKSLIKILNSR